MKKIMHIINRTSKYDIDKSYSGDYMVTRRTDGKKIFLHNGAALVFEGKLIKCALDTEFDNVCSEYKFS